MPPQTENLEKSPPQTKNAGLSSPPQRVGMFEPMRAQYDIYMVMLGDHREDVFRDCQGAPPFFDHAPFEIINFYILIFTSKYMFLSMLITNMIVKMSYINYGSY